MAREQAKKTVKKLKKNKKKGAKFVRAVLVGVITLFFVTITFLIGYGVYFLFTNDKFNIYHINVNECIKYTSEEITNASQISKGSNIFRISKSQIKEEILKLPYVENVEIDRQLPSTISIIVIERQGAFVAYAKDCGQYVRLDDKGYILEIVNVNTIEEEMLLFGINFDSAIELGQRLTDIEMLKLENYKKIREIYNSNNIQDKITSVEFKNSNIIVTLNDKLNVVLKNSTDIEYKISFLKTILKELEGKRGTLDMTQDNPTYSAI